MAGGVALAPGVVVAEAGGGAAEAPSGAIVSVAGGAVPVAAAGVAAGGIKLVPGASAGAARDRSPKCRRQSSSVIWNGLAPGARGVVAGGVSLAPGAGGAAACARTVSSSMGRKRSSARRGSSSTSCPPRRRTSEARSTNSTASAPPPAAHTLTAEAARSNCSKVPYTRRGACELRAGSSTAAPVRVRMSRSKAADAASRCPPHQSCTAILSSISGRAHEGKRRTQRIAPWTAIPRRARPGSGRHRGQPLGCGRLQAAP